MSERKRRMSVSVRSDGAHIEFFNEDGSTAGLVHRDIAGNPGVAAHYGAHLMSVGYADRVAQRVSKAFGADCVAGEARLWAQLTAGEWRPETAARGRAVAPKVPSDLAAAIAQLHQLDPETVQEDLDTRLQHADDGSPRRDARGRHMRFFTEAVCAQMLRDNPDLAAAVARIARQRADKMAQEAKAAGKQPPPAGGLSVSALFAPSTAATMEDAAQ